MMCSLAELMEYRKCGRCYSIVEDIFINPSCDHVICSGCLRPSPPKQCPVCGGELDPDKIAPDFAFKFLYRQNMNAVATKENRPSNKRRKSGSSEYYPSPISDNAKSVKNYLKRNAKGETVLHQYCSKGFTKKKGFSLEKLKSMIQEGANPNTHDAGGVTPIHEAIIYDDLEILKVLLDGGARVNCYRIPPYTPLHVAVERYEPVKITVGSLANRILKTLLDYGADVQAKDCYGRTPIDLAKDNSFLCKILSSYEPKLQPRKELFAPEMPILLFPYDLEKSDFDELKAFASRFKMKVQALKTGFTPEITHVILPKGSYKPSQSLRLAILSGCYVVTTDWVNESLKRNDVLPAEDFEISAPLLENSSVGYVSRRARIYAKSLMPKLFAGGQFHVLSNNVQVISKQEKAQIVQLIEIGGGIILSREPKSADTGEGEPILFHAKKALETIWDEIGESPIWCSIDETTDRLGRNVVNVLVGRLDGKSCSKGRLIHVTTVEKTNASTILQCVQEGQRIHWKGSPGTVARLSLFVTDSAAYMLKASKHLKALYPMVVHLTCFSHGFHRVAEAVREAPAGNKLVSSAKKVFLKAPARVDLFRTFLPETPLPPEPIVTRWVA